MTQPQKHTGSCHCGKVKFEANLDLSQVISCNCSICSRLGSVLAFTATDGFKLLAGQDQQTDYQFNRMVIHHLFCNTCGVHAYGHGTAPDGKAMVAINVRCLDGVDLNGLKPQPIDGRNA